MSLPKSSNTEYKAEIAQTRSFLRLYSDQAQCLKLEKEYQAKVNLNSNISRQEAFNDVEEPPHSSSSSDDENDDELWKNQKSFYPLCMATMDYFRRWVPTNDDDLSSSSSSTTSLLISKMNEEEYYQNKYNEKKQKQPSSLEWSSRLENSEMIHFNQFHVNSASEISSLQQFIKDHSHPSSWMEQAHQNEQFMNQVKRSRIRDVMPQFSNRLREWKAANRGAYKDVESQDETTKMFDIFLSDVKNRLANCLANKKTKWQQVLQINDKSLKATTPLHSTHEELMAKFAFAHCGASYHELLFKGVMMSCEKSLKTCLEQRLSFMKNNFRENLENEKVGPIFNCSEELLNDGNLDCSKFAKQHIFDLMNTHLK
ncbi:hypothetical protein C9374_010646 [Naegleria lovaniensis]|uniref:Uncharacterized protein n=1 Tax=Naegleria lovaniensis TaxID=51637 RepID=A0AA88GBJ2_NAELO|nr:uncharacterized protein C9374_010646 [Naegleria lovaniensis]KAG2374627.1 hypothetical protein C9374_010646 [Naegleria lovaniensis]